MGEIRVEISAADLEFEVDTEAPGSRLSDGEDAQSYLQVMKAKLSTRVSVTIVRVIANSFTAALGAFFTTGPAVLFGASFATVFEFIS